MSLLHGRHALSWLWLLACASIPACMHRPADIDVRRFGAVGDGRTLDTAALNGAVSACAAAGGRRVVVPAGRYLTGTVRLRSNVTLHLDAGAELIGTSDLDHYEHFTPPHDTPLVGGTTRWHRALVLADGAHNVGVCGAGVINGGGVRDKLGEEGVRGPHAILFGNCSNVLIRGVTIKDAGNYAILMEFTSGVRVSGVTVTGGYDGVHLRGWEGRPCRDVRVEESAFYTGDDSVAGWYWDGVRVERCVLNSSSNGVRLFGPARRVVVSDCRFFGPGKYPWPTSGLLRWTNTEAGVCIQPSAWGETPGEVDDVHVSNVEMHNVAAALHVVAKPPSTIGRVTIERLTATGVYRAAASFESWTDAPIEHVVLRDSSIEYLSRSAAAVVWSSPLEAGRKLLAARTPQDVRPPGTDSRPLPAWGLYARHVNSLRVDNVRLDIDPLDRRPAILLDGVESLETDAVKWPDNARRPMVRTNARAGEIDP